MLTVWTIVREQTVLTASTACSYPSSLNEKLFHEFLNFTMNRAVKNKTLFCVLCAVVRGAGSLAGVNSTHGNKIKVTNIHSHSALTWTAAFLFLFSVRDFSIWLHQIRLIDKSFAVLFLASSSSALSTCGKAKYWGGNLHFECVIWELGELFN